MSISESNRSMYLDIKTRTPFVRIERLPKEQTGQKNDTILYINSTLDEIEVILIESSPESNPNNPASNSEFQPNNPCGSFHIPATSEIPQFDINIANFMNAKRAVAAMTPVKEPNKRMNEFVCDNSSSSVEDDIPLRDLVRFASEMPVKNATSKSVALSPVIIM